MPPSQMDTLQKGLTVLLKRNKARKDELTLRLKRGEQLEIEDEDWLDKEGNTVEEEHILDVLKAATNYEAALETLSSDEKAIVNHLRELAGDLPSVAGNRRKRGHKEQSSRPKAPDRVPPNPVFTHKETAQLQQRIEILDWHKANGKNQSKTAKHFDPIYPNLRIKQPLISSWVKDEAMWRDRWEQAARKSDRTAKRVRQTEHPDVTEMMELWLSKAMDDGVLISGDVIREKWKTFEELAGIPEDERLNLGGGWMDSFKARNGLKQFKRHGEAASCNPTTVAEERKRIQELIQSSGYELCDIFNMDETGLFYGMAPDVGLSDRMHSGVKGKKTRITYALTSNADGSEKLPAFIIGKSFKPRDFKGKTGGELGFLYRHNAKAWMTSVLYQEWILNWDADLQDQDRKIMLLQDNFSGHIVPPGLRNIRVENFEPNLTSHVQPKDQGIIRCWKAHYRAQFIHRAVDRYDQGITPAKIYDIKQLEAMRIADAAWERVDSTTIKNCWRKAGILPDTDTSVPLVGGSVANTAEELAEKEVEQALDDLVATGALQTSNRMTLEDLVALAEESRDEGDEMDIYQAVTEARQARENLDLNGGDDADTTPAEPLPSRRDVLKAVTTITKWTETINGPLARNLESLLGSLKRDLRLTEAINMKDTLITSYFS